MTLEDKDKTQKKMVGLGVRIDEELREDFAIRCRVLHQRQSTIIAKLIDDWLRKTDAAASAKLATQRRERGR